MKKKMFLRASTAINSLLKARTDDLTGSRLGDTPVGSSRALLRAVRPPGAGTPAGRLSELCWLLNKPQCSGGFTSHVRAPRVRAFLTKTDRLKDC